MTRKSDVVVTDGLWQGVLVNPKYTDFAFHFLHPLLLFFPCSSSAIFGNWPCRCVPLRSRCSVRVPTVRAQGACACRAAKTSSTGSHPPRAPATTRAPSGRPAGEPRQGRGRRAPRRPPERWPVGMHLSTCTCLGECESPLRFPFSLLLCSPDASRTSYSCRRRLHPSGACYRVPVSQSVP